MTVGKTATPKKKNAGHAFSNDGMQYVPEELRRDDPGHTDDAVAKTIPVGDDDRVEERLAVLLMLCQGDGCNVVCSRGFQLGGGALGGVLEGSTFY